MFKLGHLQLKSNLSFPSLDTPIYLPLGYSEIGGVDFDTDWSMPLLIEQTQRLLSSSKQMIRTALSRFNFLEE